MALWVVKRVRMPAGESPDGGGHVTPAEFLSAEAGGRGVGKERRGAECWPSCC